MTYQAPAPEPLAPYRAGQVCALIDGIDLDEEPSFVVAENLLRLRRQLDLLNIKEVFGLGDIPAGASFMIVRADTVFAFAGLAALAQNPRCGAHLEDTLAAVHVEGGDAAAALAKFRRQELSGWQPFHIHFTRLGRFHPETTAQRLIGALSRRGRGVIAKAAQLRLDPYAEEADQPVREIWQSLPGLDRFVRSLRASEVQLMLRDALGLRPAGWRAIGFLLLLVMISFGAFGWTWLGAVIGLFAAGTFDLAQRARAYQDLRLSRSPEDLCIQALVISCLWLFAVFSGGYGAVAKMPALVLMAIPVAFVAAQASRKLLPPFSLEEIPFGVYLQALLVACAVASLPVPLLSIFFSAAGLLSMVAVIASAAIRLGTSGAMRKQRVQQIGMGQPAE